MTYPGALALTGVVLIIAFVLFAFLAIEERRAPRRWYPCALACGLLAAACFIGAAWWEAVVQS